MEYNVASNVDRRVEGCLQDSCDSLRKPVTRYINDEDKERRKMTKMQNINGEILIRTSYIIYERYEYYMNVINNYVIVNWSY